MATLSFCDQIQPQIQTLMPYIPGKPVSELQRELGLRRVSKLASNENPLGASPMARKAIQDEILQASRYPDGSAYYLRESLAKFVGRDFSEIAIGNGSNELLELVARVFAGPDDEIIYSQYGFAVYPISARAVGATGVEVPAKNLSHDLMAMAKAVTDKTKIIYIANPNNPTGTCFARSEFEAFLAKIPSKVIIVLDEAYYEFVSGIDYANGVDYLDAHPNLLISRTFSKAYGLAALRIGYLIGHNEIINYINRLRAPFNVNSFAQSAALAALKDQAFVEQTVAKNRQGLDQIIDFFEKHELDYIPSQGNFICLKAKGEDTANQWNQYFLEQGVILRPLANYGLAEYLRVSIGTVTEMNHFMAVLHQILKGK